MLLLLISKFALKLWFRRVHVRKRKISHKLSDINSYRFADKDFNMAYIIQLYCLCFGLLKVRIVSEPSVTKVKTVVILAVSVPSGAKVRSRLVLPLPEVYPVCALIKGFSHYTLAPNFPPAF